MGPDVKQLFPQLVPLVAPLAIGFAGSYIARELSNKGHDELCLLAFFLTLIGGWLINTKLPPESHVLGMGALMLGLVAGLIANLEAHQHC